jgi:hypothetical protein
MRNLLIIFGCVNGLASVGCGSTPAVTTTVVSKTTVTAAPPDPHADDAYTNGKDLAHDLKLEPAYKDLPGLVCVMTPIFEGDTTRWECSDDTGAIFKLNVDQVTGAATVK